MKLGVISLGGESSLHIIKEAAKYFDAAHHIDIRILEVHASSDGLHVMARNKELKNFDCLYVRGSYKYRLMQRSVTRAFFHEAYLPIKPFAYAIGHNKFLTLLELLKAGITIPKTYFAATTEAAKGILEDVQYPIIMKIPYGTQGKGVMVADSLKAAKTMLDALEVFKQPYLIQEYIETDSTDIRALVIGNTVIGMRRKAGLEELRANIHRGAKGTPCQLDPTLEQLALKSAKILKADVCAVDILEGRKPAVIEVNLSPGLAGITKATKMNVASLVAKHLAERTKEFLTAKHAQKNEKAVPRVHPKKGREVLTTLDIRHGLIRLPKFVTDLSEFTMNDEITLRVAKGKIEIIEHAIPQDD